MTTIVDNRMQYGAMGYEAMGFTNPWGERAQAQVASHLYHMPHNGMQVQQPLSRPASISMPYVNNSAQSIATGMPCFASSPAMANAQQLTAHKKT